MNTDWAASLDRQPRRAFTVAASVPEAPLREAREIFCRAVATGASFEATMPILRRVFDHYRLVDGGSST